MKQLVLLNVFFCMLLSCKKEGANTAFEPYCKLSEKEMIDVMVDLSIVKSTKTLARKDLKNSGIKPYDYLFKKHGVDTITIRENLQYYNLDLEKSQKLYDTVSKIITGRLEKVEAILDSIEAKKEETDNEKTLDTLQVDEKKQKQIKKDTIADKHE